MGELRDRMDGDMRLRGYAAVTRSEYLRSAYQFVAHYRRPPAELGAEDVRAYLLHLSENLHFSPANLKFGEVFERQVLSQGRDELRPIAETLDRAWSALREVVLPGLEREIRAVAGAIEEEERDEGSRRTRWLAGRTASA